MGLTIIVGILPELSDAESKTQFALKFQAVNGALAELGLAPHVEPEGIEAWSAEGYGYSGLHALREVAGMLWKGLTIPREPLITGKGETPLEMQLFDQALAVFTAPKPSDFSAHQQEGFFQTEDYQPGLPPFVHLVFHPDSDGFYVPRDFPMPTAPEIMQDATARIWPLGSTQRLKAEIDQLANALEIPDDMNWQDDALWEAVDNPVTDQQLWRAQPIAAYSAVVLRDACKMSLATGAAITLT